MSQILNGKFIYINNINEHIINETNNFLENKTNLSEISFEENKNWQCNVVTTQKTHPNILNAEELINLRLEVLKHCDAYMRKNNDFYDGYIDESWFNKYHQGYYQEFHRHLHKVHKHFAGVMYFTENNSEIEFFIDKTFKYTPQKGDILIFDGDFEHRVLPNTNNNLRISLAFNFKKCFSYD